MNARIKHRPFRLMAICAVVLVFVGMTVVEAGTIQIPKGTKVKMKFAPDMKISSAGVVKGMQLACYLAEPIDIGGVIVVEKDALGTATVLESVPPGRAGKPGNIKIGFTALDAKGQYKMLTPDAKIKLSSVGPDNKGKGRKTLSYLFIFGLFIKGKPGIIPVDRIYEAEVAESVLMESK